jgi:4-amino-4-deoxy-L-arabinose transferase-like glycosyltransferase
VPARAGVFLTALLLYTWDLARQGMGNTFYAAAVKAGTENWKAFFFGSLDPGNFITVDKPPAALWVQELVARVFGFSWASVLLPEALAGVAAVMVLYHLVRRWSGERAAVLAGLGLALTPAAALMFRYNNPDALLTLLLLLAAWALWSALSRPRAAARLALAGGLVGLAFLTKTLEAFIVLPAFALVYLWAGRPRLRRRVAHLCAFAGAALVSSGWWVAAVELWPASSRPYLGGSTDNSELNLILGYNGFSRIFGSGGPSGGGGGPSFAGSPGWLRMFNSLLAGEISWLLPLALVGLVAGLWATRRLGRTSLRRAGFLLWGGWTLSFLVVFSGAKGIFHPYYTVVLAPGVAALAAGGAVALWRLGRRSRRWAPVLPLVVAANGAWAAVVLHRVPDYDTWLWPLVAVGGALAAGLLALALFKVRPARLLGPVAAVVAAATLLAGPAAYSVTTARTVHTGGAVTAGPASAGGLGGPGGGPGGFAGFAGPGGGSGPGTGRAGGPPPGATGAAFGPGSTTGFPGRAGTGSPPRLGAGTAGAAAFGRGGAAGGGPGGTEVDRALVRYLEAHRHGATYLLAVSGSQEAAPYIIATGQAVMAMGGFTGSDPWPSVSAFTRLVAQGKVHYVLVGGGGGGPGGAGGGPGGGSSTGSSVLAWVEAHGTKVPASAYGGSSAGGTLYRV